jgi:AbrB family looped-hinge helix DNA binding protein
MAHSGTVSSKGQITLPKELRDRYHLHPGERILILDSSDGVLLKHGKTSLRGTLKGKLDSVEFEKDLRRLRREWVL